MEGEAGNSWRSSIEATATAERDAVDVFRRKEERPPILLRLRLLFVKSDDEGEDVVDTSFSSAVMDGNVVVAEKISFMIERLCPPFGFDFGRFLPCRPASPGVLATPQL